MTKSQVPAESEIIDRLREIASHPAARGLRDDAAIWQPPLGRELVLTHDTIARGVHYLPGADPSDIAWKLVATNLSDLAAMGAVPSGILIGLTLDREDGAWLERFAAGLARVLSEYDTALFGGDTVRAGATVLGCTAIGHVERGRALTRIGAQAGDDLYVSGTIGDAGLGLAALRGEAPADRFLERRHRLPMPRLALGQGLFAAGARAAMDVSDGLLIDADRLARASGVAAEIDLALIPLSKQAGLRLGEADSGPDGRLTAATSGDDYELLFAVPPAATSAVVALAGAARTPVTRIGGLSAGRGIRVLGMTGEPLAPGRLGFTHDAPSTGAR
ncbi:thiamine-phosphate kinase [Pacificimonas pallii]|uniref:thiamine-phosphate kinase n=1 Tax=Pacificimonas pallii TaxID=2827236 RepID=UPI0034E1E505